jgi:hypothetical protein
MTVIIYVVAQHFIALVVTLVHHVLTSQQTHHAAPCPLMSALPSPPARSWTIPPGSRCTASWSLTAHTGVCSTTLWISHTSTTSTTTAVSAHILAASSHIVPPGSQPQPSCQPRLLRLLRKTRCALFHPVCPKFAPMLLCCSLMCSRQQREAGAQHGPAHPRHLGHPRQLQVSDVQQQRGCVCVLANPVVCSARHTAAH